MATPTDKSAEGVAEATGKATGAATASSTAPKVEAKSTPAPIVDKAPAPVAGLALVKNILVLRFSMSADRVVLNTSLPEAMYPFTDKLTLEFSAARGTGVEYCEKHFPGVPVELKEYE